MHVPLPRFRSFASLAGLLAVLASLVLVPGTAAAASEGEAFVGHINNARAASGLGALRTASDLTSVAQAHAERMGREGRLYHNASLTTQVTNWEAIGENVGYGGSVDVIHRALMDSAPHRANILSGTYTEVGVGTFWAGSTLWVTQVFRKPMLSTGYSVSAVLSPTVSAHAALLGAPTSHEYPVPGGVAQDFEGGDVLWSSATQAQIVMGAIRTQYRALGGARSPLGLPVSSEAGTPHRPGRFNHFQGGSVYWSAASGAHVIYGEIRGTWGRLGWENGSLGFPTTDELATPHRFGRFNHFQGGSVYWSPASGAHQVTGAIRHAWGLGGWESGGMGFPLTDERSTSDGVGRYNHFQGGSVFWSPTTGAHLVYGGIRAHWISLGAETGRLGYPTSSEYAVPGGRRSDFQHGSIVWDAVAGTTSVR